MLACPTLHACPSDIKAIAEGTGVDKAELCSRLVRAALSSVAPILSRELRSSPLSSLWRGCINGGRRGCSREILRCRVCATRIIRRAPAPNSSLPARPLVLYFGILVFRPKVGVLSTGSSRLIDVSPESGPSDSGRRDALRCHLGLAVPAVAEGVLVERQLLLGQVFHTSTENPVSRNTLMPIGSASSSTGCAAMLDWEIGNTLKETADQERQSPRGTQLPAPL